MIQHALPGHAAATGIRKDDVHTTPHPPVSGSALPYEPVGFRVRAASVPLVSVLLFLSAMPLIGIVYGTDALFLCLAGLLAWIAVLAPVLLRKRYDVMEPITFVALSALIGTTLKTFYVVMVDSPWVDEKLLLGHEPRFLIIYALLIAVALMSLSIGYMIRVPRIRLENWRFMQREDWSFPRLALIGVVFLLISSAAFVVYSRKMGIDFSSLASLSSKRFYELGGDEHAYRYSSLTYYRWGASLVTPVFYLFLVWFLGSGKRMASFQGLLLLFLGTAAIGFPFLNSSRDGAARVLLVTIVLYAYMRRSIRPRTLLSIGAVAAVLIMVMSGLRSSSGEEQVRSFLGVSQLLDETVGGRHFLDLTKTAHIIDAVPDKVPYAYGATFIRFIYLPIPRSMWPEKPAMGSGPMLGTVVFGTPNEYTGGVPPGFVAELYMNFGLVGVLGGMFLLGVLLRFIYRSFEPVLRSGPGVLIYCLMVITLTHGILNGDAAKMPGALARDLMPIIVGILFIGRRFPVPAMPRWSGRGIPALR